MTTLLAIPEIVIGAGSLDRLGAAVCSRVGPGKRVFMVSDPGLRAAGIAGRADAGLAAAGLEVVHYDGFAGEPKAAEIDQAAALARKRAAGAVVGIGGGSALDIAKLVAAITAGDAGADHYQLGRHPFPPARLPLIQVPTTAGTGSETTTTAVHTNAEGKKVWTWGPELAAAGIILDPELTRSLPPLLTAATGLDAMVHAIEASTNRNRSDANDHYCHAAIRLVARWLPVAVDAPDSLAAREAMLWAACLAGIGINNAGTAIAHTAAHAIGSLARVHHGRAAAVGLLATLPWAIEANTEAFAAAAEAMGGPRDAAQLAGLVDGLMRRAGISPSIAAEMPGISPERLAAEMAAPANSAMRHSTARASSDDDLLTLARAILGAG